METSCLSSAHTIDSEDHVDEMIDSCLFSPNPIDLLPDTSRLVLLLEKLYIYI